MHNIDCRTWYSLSICFASHARPPCQASCSRARALPSSTLPSQRFPTALFETRKHCDLVSCWLSIHKSHDNAHMQYLSQCFARECRQNEAGFVNLLVVIFAQLVFLLRTPGSDRCFDISVGIFATDHETNLARRIGGNGGIGILGHGEDFLAVFLELGDEW